MVDPNSWLGQIIIQVGMQSMFEGGKLLYAHFRNANTAKLAEAELEKEAKQAAESVPESEYVSLSSKVNWNNVASLFWLGNDLMWIQDMIIRGASPQRIYDGINGTIRYVKELGFTDETPAMKQLSKCKAILSSLTDINNFTEDKVLLVLQQYRTVYLNVQTVKWFIHGVTSDKQPGFKKHRAGYLE